MDSRRNPYRAKIALILLACGANASCVRKVSESDVAHRTDDVLRFGSDAPWMWTDVPESVMRSHVAKSLKLAPEQLFGSDSSAATYLQGLVDRFDAAFRSHVGPMPQIPKPRVLLAAVEQPNAAMIRFDNCYRVKVLADDRRNPKEVDGTIVFPNPMVVLTSELPACESWDKYEPYRIVEWISKNYPGCNLRWEAGVLRIPNTCQPYSDPMMLGNYVLNTLRVSASSNWMVVYSGVLSLPNPDPRLNPTTNAQERFMALVAHELSHYYRSHVGLFPQEANYWYERRFPPANARPEPTRDPGKLEWVNILKSKRVDRLKPVPGSKLSPEAGALLLGVVAGNSELRSLLNRTVYRERFGGVRIPAEQQAQLDAQLATVPKTCIDALSILPDYMNPGASISEFAKLKAPVVGERGQWVGYPGPRGIWGFWLSVTADREAQIQKYLSDESNFLACADWMVLDSSSSPRSVSASVVNNQLQYHTKDYSNLVAGYEGKSVREILPLLEKIGGAPAIRYAMEVRKAADFGLGFYTSEEEADNYSLELLSWLGVNARAASDLTGLFLSMDASNPNRDPVLDVDVDNCIRMKGQGWRERPFIGPFELIHHTDCYRIFNQDQEVLAHGYALQTTSDLISESSWSRFVTESIQFQRAILARIPRPDPVAANQAFAKNAVSCDRTCKR